MERLTGYFVRRPLAVNILVAAIAILGAQTVVTIQKESFPRVSKNTVVITTIYPGASALDLEINVTVPIEEALAEVSGIQEVLSVSREAVSTVSVVVDENAAESEFRRIYNDVEAAVAKVTDLPAEIDGRPVLRQVTSDDTPVVEVSIGNGGSGELRPFVLDLEERIRRLPGVAQVYRVGLPDEEVQILVDAARARRNNVDLKSIYAAIRSRNLEGSGGTLESFLTEKKVVAYTKFQTYEEVLETDLRRSVEGYGVRLADVATVAVKPKDLKLTVLSNGRDGASLLVTRKPTADIVRTVDGIAELVASVPKPAGVEVRLLNDQSYLAKNRISLLVGNAAMGFLLVVALLYYTLGGKMAFWVAFGIPLSLLGLFALLPVLGITLNAVTLGGCVMVLGMLVDDGVVIAEQINKKRLEGLPPFEAAMAAVADVWKPVFASSATTMIAFSPMLYLGGLPGKFVWIIPLVVILTLGISLFESYLMLPAHLSHGRPSVLPKKAFIVWLENTYEKTLIWALRRRYLVVPLFVGVLASSAVVAARFVTKDPFPQEAAEGFLIKTTLPPGTVPTQARRTAEQVARVVTTLPKEELAGVTTRLGTHSPLPATERGLQSNLSISFAYLTPYAQRKRTAQQIMDDVAHRLPSSAEARHEIELIRLGPPVGKPFEIRIAANEDELRAKRVAAVKGFLTKIRGVHGVADDELWGTPEINLRIQHPVLASVGLTTSDILTTLRIAFDGAIVSRLTDQKGSKDFRLRLNEAARADRGFLDRLPIQNREQYMIPLSNMVTLEERPARAEMVRVDGRRTTTVYGQLDKSILSPGDVMRLVEKQFPSDRNVRISFAGEPVENQKIFGGLGLAAIVAVVGVYLMIALVFNSLGRPLIVMASVPFVFVGIAWGLFAHGMAISMFALLGLIGLVGVIVNNGIVMVYTISELETPVSHASIIQGAVSRLRPVALTTLTTILGLFPTAYGIGGFDPFISPMCLAMAYGLLFGSAIILVLVPCLYAIGRDLEKLPERARLLVQTRRSTAP